MIDPGKNVREHCDLIDETLLPEVEVQISQLRKNTAARRERRARSIIASAAYVVPPSSPSEKDPRS